MPSLPAKNSRTGLEWCRTPTAKEAGTLFDYIAANTNPDPVNFELDILWAQFPGINPANPIRKYPARIRLTHMKDLKKGVTGDLSGKTDVNNDVALGTGQINLPEVIKAATKAGVSFYYIEDESDFVKTQVPQSPAYLRKMLRIPAYFFLPFLYSPR